MVSQWTPIINNTPNQISNLPVPVELAQMQQQQIANQFASLPEANKLSYTNELAGLSTAAQQKYSMLSEEEKQTTTLESIQADLKSQLDIRYQNLNSAYELQTQMASGQIVAPYSTYAQELVNLAQTGESLQQQASTISNQLATYEPPKAAGSSGSFGIMPSIAINVMGKSVSATASTEQQNSLLDQLSTTATDIYKNQEYIALYSYLPALVSSGTVTKIDDIFALDGFQDVANSLGITKDDPTINHLLNSLLGATAQAVDSSGNTVIKNPDLTYDQLIQSLTEEEKSIPVSINQLTQSEIMSALSANQTEYATADTETATQALDTLKNGGVSEELADELTSIADITSELSDRWKTVSKDYADVLGGIKTAKLPDVDWQKQLKIIAATPVTALFDVFKEVNEHYFAPLAGTLFHGYEESLDTSNPYLRAFNKYMLGGGIISIFAKDPADTNFDILYQDYTDKYGLWEGAGKAYDEAGLGWANRVMFSYVYEPSTYLGFGLYSKAGKAIEVAGAASKWLKPLEIAGKGLGTLEHGYVQMWDAMIFDRLKDFGKVSGKLAGKVPVFGILVAAPFGQLPYQIAEKTASSDMIAVSRWLNIASGRFFWKVPAKDAAVILKEARNYALKHPQDLSSPRALAGRALLRGNELDEEAVTAIVRKLGSTEKITPELIIDVNQIVFRTAVSGEVLNPTTAAALLLQRLGIHDTPEALIAARHEIESMMKRGVKSSDDILQSASKVSDILASVYKNTSISVYDTLKSRAAFNLSMTGRISAGMSKQSWKVIELQRNIIDRWLVTPMARSYLVFGAYGFFNVLEGFVKPLLATDSPINPFWKFGKDDPIDLMQKATSGTSIPTSLFTTTAVSEMSAPLPTLLDINGMTPALKKFRSAMSGGPLGKFLVDYPGRIGAYQRANYYGKLFIRSLADDSPETMSALVRTVDAHINSLPDSFYHDLHISKSSLRKQYIYSTVGGRENVKQMLTDIVSKRLTDKQADNLLSTVAATNAIDEIIAGHPEMDAPIMGALRSMSADGSLYANEGKAISKFFDDDAPVVLYDYVTHSPEMQKARFEELASKVMSANPQNKAEMLTKLGQIKELLNFVPESSSDTLRAAMEMKGKMQRQLAFAEWQKWKETYLGKVYDGLANYAESTSRQFADIMKQMDDDIARLSMPKEPELMQKVPITIRNKVKNVRIGYTEEDYAGLMKDFPKMTKAEIDAQFAAYWNPESKEIVFHDKSIANNEFIFNHEVAHAYLDSMNLGEVSDILTEYARSTGRELKEVSEEMEMFADDFASWSTGKYKGTKWKAAIDASNFFDKKFGNIHGDYNPSFASAISSFRTKSTLLDNETLKSRINSGIDLLEELTTQKNPSWDNIISKVELFAQDLQYQTLPSKQVISKADQTTLGRLIDMLESEKYTSPVALASRDVLTSMCLLDPTEFSKSVKDLQKLLKTDSRFSRYFTTATGALTSQEADAARLTMKHWTAENQYTQQFIAQLRSTQQELLKTKPKGGPELSKFWQDFNTKTENMWNQWRIGVAPLKKDTASVSAELSRALHVSGPEPRTVDASDRPLTRADIADLFNGDPGKVSGSLIKTDTLMLEDRLDFISDIQAQAERMASRTGKSAEQLGFTYDSISKLYDDCLRDLKMNPATVSVLEPKLQMLQELKNEVWNVYHTKGVPAGTAHQLETMSESLYDDLGKVPGYGDDAWQASRQRSADKASKEYYKDWADYDNVNVLTTAMRTFFPFFTYESHRMFWLPRTMLRKPVIARAWGTYMDNTDNGYVHIPGTSLEVNPLRGTIFMGGLTSLMKYSYPNYYDNFPGMTDLFTGLSNYGFYPAAYLNFLKIAGGATSGGRMNWGEIIPSWIKDPLNMLVAADPDNKVAKTVLDSVLAEPYRDYTTVMLASKLCEDEKRDFTGEEIYEHIRQGIALTPEEQSVWNRALQQNGWMQIALDQSSMMRLRTENKIKAQEAIYKLYEQFTGYTKEQQKWLTSHGYKLSDFVSLDPLQQDVMYQLDTIKYNPSITLALMPSSQQDAQILRNSFWRSVSELKERYNSDTEIITSTGLHIVGQEALDAAWQAGTINGADWTSGHASLNQAFATAFAALAESEQYKNIPITLEDTKNSDGTTRIGIITAMKTQGQTPTTEHPAQELLNLYYSMQPETVIDPETGQASIDWDGYYLKVDTIINTLTADQQTEFVQMITKNMTPIEKVRYQVSKDYFQAYNSRYRAVLTLFSADQQALIKEYDSASPDRRAAIKEILLPNGAKLISTYNSLLKLSGENLRKMSPELDAWLRVFGKTTSLLTVQAEAIYKQNCDLLGVPY